MDFEPGNGKTVVPLIDRLEKEAGLVLGKNLTWNLFSYREWEDNKVGMTIRKLEEWDGESSIAIHPYLVMILKTLIYTLRPV